MSTVRHPVTHDRRVQRPHDHPEPEPRWPEERLEHDRRQREERERAKATVVPVPDLMDTNAGDESHLAENWVVCPNCCRDTPADYDGCAWGCE